MEYLQHDVSLQKNKTGGNPAQRKQQQDVKSYGPFLAYLRSLTFIKNVLIGCLYPGMMAVMLYQEKVLRLVVCHFADPGCFISFCKSRH